MSNTHIVFNDQLEDYGLRYITKVAPIAKDEKASGEYQRRKILAILFEQFLLYDKIAIKIDRQSLGLYFLIKELGINKVEELLDHGVIIPILWTPMIFTSLGRKLPDGTFDETSIIGQPPIVPGYYSPDEINPEKNIDSLLQHFGIDPGRKKIFKRKALKKYVLPDNSIAKMATDLVMDSYAKGQLSSFGLNPQVKPEELGRADRDKLLDLGNNLLETTILSRFDYKSYDKYSRFILTKDSVRNIESAYHVSQNTSEILRIENLANIKQYVMENRIPFERVFDIRYKPNIKAYRKWINSISANTDATSITKEYIDEVEGKNNFFESTKGKFARNVVMLGLGSGLGALVAGPLGALGGSLLGKTADLGLSMFDSCILDGILKGWNPRMFVDEIRYETSEPAKLNLTTLE